MTTVTSSIDVQAPKAEVWAALANLGGIQNFHPGVSKSYYTTNKKEGVGAARICELLPMGKVEEHVLDWQPGRELTLDVIPVEKAPPLKDATGRIELKDQGNGSVRVTMTLQYGLKFGLVGALMDRLLVRPQFTKMVPAVLKGLKRHVETGEVLHAAEKRWAPAAA